MKITALAIAIGLGIAALVVTTGSCSINHRSDGYACNTTTDCSTGRTCQGGFCVSMVLQPDAATKDTGNNCPAGCTTCNVAQKTCDINCQTGGGCNGAVTCPTGYRCTIECNTQNSCKNGVNCRNAASCQLTCSGQSSCQGVECGAGPCDVVCTGQESCQGVTCGNSCACDVVCTSPTSCASGITCTSIACRTNPLGCTSQPAFCHSC